MSDKLETNDLRGGLTHRITAGPYDGRADAREARPNSHALDFFGDPIAPAQHSAKLSEEFVYPPFSVLNARDGWWQERKREWLALGIQSELGRGTADNNAAPGGSARPLDRMKQGLQEGQIKGKPNATPGGSAMPSANYSKDHARGDGRGRPMRRQGAGDLTASCVASAISASIRGAGHD